MAKGSAKLPPAEHDAPLGKRLRDRRQQLGLTLKQVADGAGLSVGFISQIERGLNAPSFRRSPPSPACCAPTSPSSSRSPGRTRPSR